ncbi:MAG: acyltransferase family protein, partial [Eubacterium sp.]|nr:acyltransferase family protein [Eubacterium sp.]
MSKARSKRILGLFAILIMMHHLGQKVSAFWVPASVRQHGLEPFVPIGFLLVSFFFFCSGYGLRKRMKEDDDYFKGFLVRRLNRILMILVITNIIYLIVRHLYGTVYLPANPYSWYAYSIIVMYFGFFLIYRKENKVSHFLMALWILAYSVICYILISGNWWYNTPPVFLLGIIMADKEEAAAGEEKSVLNLKLKDKLIRIIVPVVIFIVTFILSENMPGFYHIFGINNYGIVNIIIVILQIICCSALSYSIYVLAAGKEEEEKEGKMSFKKVAGIALAFYGRMTLEFYLIHGLFIQLFGHHFVDDKTPPVFYIKNVFLYVLVVFVLATVSAFVLKLAADLMTRLYETKPIFERIFNDQKRLVLIVLGILVIITIIYSVYRHSVSSENDSKLEEYKKETITYVNVDGTDVAAHVEGEGKYTVVLLGSDWDPCPTMYLVPMLNNLKDTYKVVIIDFPGKGFSEKSDAERTTQYFVDIIHGTLEGLGIKENIILVPNQISAIYSYSYIEKYPDEVAGLVGIDAVFPELATRFLDGNYNSVDEYRWNLKRISRLEKLNQNFLVLTGYVTFQTPVYDYVFYGSGLKEYYGVMEEMYIRNYMQDAQLLEQKNVYDNCMSMDGYTLPDDLHVSFLL